MKINLVEHHHNFLLLQNYVGKLRIFSKGLVLSQINVVRMANLDGSLADVNRNLCYSIDLTTLIN